MTDSILEPQKRFIRPPAGLLASIDMHFADQMAVLDTPSKAELWLAAALVSRATGAGHVCLDLTAAAQQTGWPRADLPPPASWSRQLRNSRVVGRPGDFAPLILDDRNRLYLHRYWQYEQNLIEGIRLRLTPSLLPEVDRKRLQTGLARLFALPPAGRDVDWQKVAAMAAVVKRFCVISGGPGTGKTHTIAKILVLLLEQSDDASLRICLAAPTGKAAARLGDSLQAAGESLDCPSKVKAAMPTAAVTLHRLLKPVAGTPNFRYNSENRLPADAVIVDEASMVDLALMAKMIQSLPDHARLILVGDRDQLASVEAGAALGDICGRGLHGGYSEEFQSIARQVAGESLRVQSEGEPVDLPIRDSIVHLAHSYRFSGSGGIGALSRAVNAGDAETVLAILRDDADRTVSWRPTAKAEWLRRELQKRIVNEHGRVVAAADPVQGLAELNRFRLLCALKSGPQGADTVNRLCEQILRAENMIPSAEAVWYAGRPILITENDYTLGLFNGDIGLTAPDPAHSGDALQVWFPAVDGALRRIPSFRIGAHQTVFAMTVHKSQGSEFDHVFLVLPETDAPVLTRELLYTAVTRARRSVTLWGSEKILRAAVGRKIERSSGLRDGLWA